MRRRVRVDLVFNRFYCLDVNETGLFLFNEQLLNIGSVRTVGVCTVSVRTVGVFSYSTGDLPAAMRQF